MINPKNIENRMLICISNIDDNLDFLKKAREEQVETLNRLAQEMEIMNSAMLRYRARMEQNRIAVARTDILAQRLQTILSAND